MHPPSHSQVRHDMLSHPHVLIHCPIHMLSHEAGWHTSPGRIIHPLPSSSLLLNADDDLHNKGSRVDKALQVALSFALISGVPVSRSNSSTGKQAAIRLELTKMYKPAPSHRAHTNLASSLQNGKLSTLDTFQLHQQQHRFSAHI